MRFLFVTSRIPVCILLIGCDALSQPAHPSLQVAGTMDLARLVDLTASQLKVSIEYDAGQVKGSTTLRIEGTLSERELWELTNRQLVARGLTTIVMPGASAYTVVQLQNAAGLAQIEPGVFPEARRRAADSNEAPVAPEPAAPQSMPSRKVPGLHRRQHADSPEP